MPKTDTHCERVLRLLSDHRPHTHHDELVNELMQFRPLLFAVTKEEERFLTKVRETEAKCWEWQGSKNPGGYGQFQYGGRPRMAHRVMHAWFYGPEELDSGLHVDHLCRNTSCVNPLHLEAVTQAENNRRAHLGVPKPLRSHCRAGHELSGENVAPRSDGKGVYCRTCSRESCRRYASKRRAS